jgi:hypothetical protein
VTGRWLVWALVGLALVACVAGVAMAGSVAFLMVNFPDPPTSPLRLPSGGEVDVIGIRTAEGQSALWELEHRTRIRLSDRSNLAEEVSVRPPSRPTGVAMTQFEEATGQ